MFKSIINNASTYYELLCCHQISRFYNLMNQPFYFFLDLGTLIVGMIGFPFLLLFGILYGIGKITTCIKRARCSSKTLSICPTNVTLGNVTIAHLNSLCQRKVLFQLLCVQDVALKLYQCVLRMSH